MKHIEICAALAGLASPLILAAMTVAVASARPEYSHLRNTISELGSVGARGAQLMNLAGIVPAGILVALSVFAAQRVFGADAWSTAGSIALVLGGAALAATALSPWRGAPTDLSLLPNQLHFVFAMTGFLCLALAPLFFGLQARSTARDWFLVSLAAGAGVLVLGFWPLQGEFRGLLQRASLAVFFTWLAAVCLWTLSHPLSD